MEPLRLVQRVLDPAVQHLVGLEADRVEIPSAYSISYGSGMADAVLPGNEAANTQGAVAGVDRHEYRSPVVGAGHVAVLPRRLFNVANWLTQNSG